MKQSDMKAFADMWRDMAALFNRDVTDGAVLLAMTALQKYDFEAVFKAMSSAIQRNRFMPTPAEIVEILEGGSVKERALTAWTNLVSAREKMKIDSNASIASSDPCVLWAIKSVGGWKELYWSLLSDDRTRAETKKEFCAAYESAVKNGVTFDDIGGDHLVGDFERQGIFPKSRLVQIGNCMNSPLIGSRSVKMIK